MQTGRLVVGVTGASGAIYAQRFIQQAALRYKEIYLVISEQGVQVARTELGVAPDKVRGDFTAWLGGHYPNLRLCADRDYFTPPASGSFVHDGMVVVPCSMGTVARIAHGISDNLMTRCADVCMKEGRKLIVVPREMPMNTVMLRNLATLSEMGVVVLPACPAWYNKPEGLEALADTVVARILQQLGQDQDLVKPWMQDE